MKQIAECPVCQSDFSDTDVCDWPAAAMQYRDNADQQFCMRHYTKFSEYLRERDLRLAKRLAKRVIEP